MKSYDRGNKLFGVYINGIKDKNNQTFPQGPNPFSKLGFFIDAFGNLKNYQEVVNGEWVIYQDLKLRSRDFERKFWNQGYKLSNWVPCYDWVTHNGYNNFASWVENTK